MSLVLLIIKPAVIHSQELQIDKKEATALVIKNARFTGLTLPDVEEAIVSDAFIDKFAGTKMVYLQQAYKKIAVAGRIKVLAFKDDKIVSANGEFIPKIALKVNNPDGVVGIDPGTAVTKAAAHVARPLPNGLLPESNENLNGKTLFPTYNISYEPITAKTVWIADKDERLVLCWQVFIAPVATSDYWLINVNAKTGEVIGKENLTVYEKAIIPADNREHSANVTDKLPQIPGTGNSAKAVTGATYRIIPFPAESVIHPGGTPVLVTDPWNNAGANNPATTIGWHFDGVLYHDSTKGNNVWAKEDRAGNDGSGRAAVSSTTQPSLSFDFPFNDQVQPVTTNNQSFAITQLFYWNNIMHDIAYQYGFDEVAGNFQNTNLARGGVAGDYVRADAQDGSGTNNANFSTPEDGLRPRMQMYLFNSSQSRTLKIYTPSSLAGYKTGVQGNVSTANNLNNVGPAAGAIVLYGDANNQGCTALSGAPLTGKIALIDDGGCNYTAKIKNAQVAGAVGVIVVKATSGTPSVMSGSDNTITTPAIMITMSDGAAIKAAITSGETVTGSMSIVNIDGDIDNGVVAHEYTHGISNRLTGGPSNADCLINKEQMGEGWSDYFALMTTTNWATAQVTDGSLLRPIGNYVTGQSVTGSGIRTYPYTTNMNRNPWTYGMVSTSTNGEPHAIGEIWAATLWDMTWNIIQMKGINPDLYNASATGGNSIALKLITEGMKLQACRPGFLDGRDAILKADSILYAGQYSCAIWKAFARRGMGILAIQGSSDNYTDQLADFTVPTGFVKKQVDKTMADQNEVLTYTLTANCKCVPMTNFKITDTLDTNVTYISGGTYNAANRTVTFDVPSLTEGQTQSFDLHVRVNSNSYTAPAQLLDEPVSGTTLPATFVATATGTGAWSSSATRAHTGTNSLKAIDSNVPSRQVLTSSGSYNITGLATLSFWHYFDTEESYDGGVVEVSSDLGATWQDVGKYMTQNGYNSIVGAGSGGGFSGSSGSFIQTVVNLSAFKNKTIKIRFVFTSDDYVGVDGWYIDDISLRSEAGIYNLATLLNNTDTRQSSSDASTFITANFPLVWGDFTVNKMGAKAVVRWTTMQEEKTSYFVVERSTNGRGFQSIGSLKAAGHTAGLSDYSFIDSKPYNGINYYRIKQVDFDGRSGLSPTRNVSFGDDTNMFVISPNPATDKITITVSGGKPSTFNIYTAVGEKVGTFKATGPVTNYNVNRLSKGMYLLQAVSEEQVMVQKFVVE